MAKKSKPETTPVAADLPEGLFDPWRPRNPFLDNDLLPYRLFFTRRISLYRSERERILSRYGSLSAYADLHLTLGMHKTAGDGGEPVWVLREWMPAATELWLTTDYLHFGYDERFAFKRITEAGLWSLTLPADALPHGTYIELRLRSALTGNGPPAKRVPAFAVWVEQDAAVEEQWCARVWDPAEPYVFLHDGTLSKPRFPRIYEAHVGIAQAYERRTEKSVGTFRAFTRHILPYIRGAGYSAVQLMGILEHPLYKSFGYQATGYFAVSSRFGSPDDFRELVDTAHALGLAVILDIPHSHAAPNTEQGIARYDTSRYFFQEKSNQWGTASFDYAQEMTRRFLLSNCRYWLEDFHVDGFRFDAVGNMVYTDHGFGDDFNHVSRCFYDPYGNERLDKDGVLYLSLANDLVHEIQPHGVTLAEEFSGMPGLTSTQEEGGLGFDYRFAMGIPDFWGKFIKEGRAMGDLWYEMNNHRLYDKTISYVACHDQCINGKDAMIWRIIGDDMYAGMSRFTENWKTSRGVAQYKMMRLITLATADKGWLNFMGDEFGHPEWIDAEAYGHRQWQLPLDHDLKYHGLAAFDRDSLRTLIGERLADFEQPPLFASIHEEHRILAFTRGSLLFVFNFHQLAARPDLTIPVHPGKYVEFLCSDSRRYAGHGDLEISSPPTEHFSRPENDRHVVTLYLPPMVGLVLYRE